MKKTGFILLSITLSSLSAFPSPSVVAASSRNVSNNLQTVQSDALKSSMTKLETELVAKYGEPQRARLQRGMKQVVSFWRAEDGDAAAFEELVRANFAGDQATLDTMFNRFQYNLEKLNGHMGELGLKKATGAPVGPDALLVATKKALSQLNSAH